MPMAPGDVLITAIIFILFYFIFFLGSSIRQLQARISGATHYSCQHLQAHNYFFMLANAAQDMNSQ